MLRRRPCTLGALLCLSLVLAPCPDPVSAQDGQGNAVLTMGGDCSPGSSLDFQVRGCAQEGAKAFLLMDTELGPFVHPRGTFCLAFSENLVILRGRVDENGMAFFWLPAPDDPELIGKTLYWQAAILDPTAPNGIAITNCLCFPLCRPGETYSCEGGISKLEGIMVIGPVANFPLNGTFRLKSGSDTLVSLDFEYVFPGPATPVASDPPLLSIPRIVPLDPCGRTGPESRLAVQFRVLANSLPGGVLPDSTTFEVEADGEITSKTIDTSCDTPIGVGIRTRPLILTCIEELDPDLGEIGDFVYCDVDDDGVQDANEPGIEGIVIDLRCAGPDETLDTEDDVLDQTTTDSDGRYLFSEVSPGNCRVSVDLTSGPEDKLPGKCPPVVTVELAPGQSYLDADFCFVDAVCLVIIDEDTIDNGFSTIEAAAASHNTESDRLVNDDRPTETSNPPLRWNELFPGDVVLLPGGEVDDEGIFALPEDTPFTLEDYAAGTVPQEDLDPVFDVMPLRNHELFDLIGLTCTAVVYDSDISMNFLPIQGNLQGARYGLFTFTVLDVVVAGSLPESTSSSSLYDLLVRVEAPRIPNLRYDVQIRDHEPDSIEVTRARYSDGTGILEVYGVSNFSPGAVMTVSIDGFVLEAPMTYNPGQGRYEYVINPGVDLDGRRITISTDEGGADRVHIE